MIKKIQYLALVGISFLPALAIGAPADDVVVPGAPLAMIWQDPGDMKARDLFYGPGGEKDIPKGPFKFQKEDLNGTNPKFVVRDPDGTKWKVKLGEEVQPETAASRLVWAAGYYADEDYFLPEIKVNDLPDHLHRGQNKVEPGGVMRNVRLKRYLDDEKKAGDWSWQNNVFTGRRELNGLRVMMALINNWDLKNENNAVYNLATDGGPTRRVYLVSDLGASFGTPGRSVTRAESKGNLNAYSHSEFIRGKHESYVDFNVPNRPALIHVFELPEFVKRVELRSIGEKIPIADCQWIGHILAGLSPEQIKAAFTAAGYASEQAEGFATVVQNRIAQLNAL